MNGEKIYAEKVSSLRTGLLFLGLCVIFTGLVFWKLQRTPSGSQPVFFLLLTIMFLFYTLNYRTLVIEISKEEVSLQFGLFHWHIPLDTIASCYIDTAPLWRIGGAGIHFSFFNKRYRAMFNYLEHDRVVLSLNKKKGLVSEVAFSTREPERVMDSILSQIKQGNAA
jgi:hypothetical protein